MVVIFKVNDLMLSHLELYEISVCGKKINELFTKVLCELVSIDELTWGYEYKLNYVICLKNCWLFEMIIKYCCCCNIEYRNSLLVQDIS